MLVAGRSLCGIKMFHITKPWEQRSDNIFRCITNGLQNWKFLSSSEKSKFLVLPYTNAFKYSSSGVIPLAYTFSKHVNCFNVESLTEYVDHGKTGFIFETGNREQLANYMIELLENNSKCAEMGKNAYEKMLHQMSLERYCETLNKLYQIRE